VTWELEFYADKYGREPVKEWLESLDGVKRAAAMRGLSVILANEGPGVSSTEYGKPLKKGLFEFRLRIDATTVLAKHDPALLAKFPDQPRGPVLLRVFCHASDGKLILLLGAYDKGKDSSDRRQKNEIAVARARLRDWQSTSRDGSRFRSWWIRQVRR
jgi:hypothetical protein